jgi:DnaA family protein
VPQLLLELAAPPAPTFDNFVAGGNAAALAVLRGFGTAGSPDRCVYLWGAPGSGRSHLLSAWLAGRDPATCVVRDDVEALDQAAQIELFSRINDARAERGYVLAAGCAAPAQLPVRDDLKSRLGWGLSFEVLPLTDAEKQAAVQHQARARGMALGADVVAYIMTHVRRDMATLAGIVEALDQFSLEHKRPVTLPLVRELLAQNRTLDL